MPNLSSLKRLPRRGGIGLLRAAARLGGRRLRPTTRRNVASDLLSYPLWQLPGHYYSPLPDPETAVRAAGRDVAAGPVDVELNEARQLALLESLVPMYGDVGFPAAATDGWHFYHENTQFPYADAILLNLLLRTWRPKRIVEVGSGYSTAAMIDTVERFLDDPIAITCIEPNADRLRDLVDVLPPYVTLIERAVQDTPLDTFDRLSAGDVLFIDSTHVAKTGSDVVYELFDVLPRLAPGVHVHFHDICWPFEYPVGWVRQGRSWNEAYLLHAYLAYSTVFEVSLFNHMMLVRHSDWFAEHMPRCLTSREGITDDVSGHGIWLLRQPTAV